MEDGESMEMIFSRFQTLVVGLKVLNKGYSTTYHVKKIIKSLPVKWRPMVTALKLAKDLNNTSLEELISSLRSHEIEMEQDKPQKMVKSVNLKSTSGKTKAYQAKEEYEEDSDDDDELSLISRRIGQIQKHR